MIPNRRLGRINPAQHRLRDSAVDGHSIFPELSGKDFTVGGQPGQEPTVTGVRFNINVTKTTAERRAGSFGQPVETLARLGRDADGVWVAGKQPLAAQPISDCINLVEYKQGVFHIDTKLLQHPVDCRNLLLD